MLSRSLRFASRQTRLLSTSRIAFSAPLKFDGKTASDLSEVTGPDGSLIGPGAKPGTIPSDLDQATGLERLEVLGKREGVDVFDLENPISEGSGSPQDPYLVPTYVGYRYVGCKGKEGHNHKPYWMKVEDGHLARCWQCGNSFTAKYLGEPGMSHH
ncbi:cytochrome c oxidase subunit VB-domain-containing protein [Scheffersomyces amazonensis]|uniref:cytochrome c oxidase subunit VB-domain-containing protein n=1 Tax=Scheffersomyces amazonensis TaxID=1078765 RepID=UPI00315DB7E4